MVRLLILTLAITCCSVIVRADTGVLKKVTTRVQSGSQIGAEPYPRTVFGSLPGNPRRLTRSPDEIFMDQGYPEGTPTLTILGLGFGASVSNPSFSVTGGSGGSRASAAFMTAPPRSALVQILEVGRPQFVNYTSRHSSERAMLVLLGLTFGAMGFRAARQH